VPRRHHLSLVPSLGIPPTKPGHVLLLLLASGAAVFAMLMVFLLFGTPFVLALPGVDVGAMLRLTLAEGTTGALVLLFFSYRELARVRPLYEILLLGPRAEPRAPAPDEATVRAAFRLPERIVYRTVACIIVVPLLDATGLVEVSGLTGWSRVSVDLLTMAVSTAGATPAVVLFRQVMWRWLGRLHPTDVNLPASERLGVRMAVTVAVPVAVVGVSGVVALASHLLALRTRLLPQIPIEGMATDLDLTAAALSLAMIAVTSGLAFSLARKLGDQLARDLGALSERIELVHGAQSPSDSADIKAFGEIGRTPAGEKLASALSELASRFAQMSSKEREGRIAMEQVQKLRTQFLASMSHDLRSPLNSIVGFATLIESGAEGPVTAEQRESIQMITRSARDLLRLISNILDSARLEAGRLRLRRTLTPSGEILAQAVTEGRRLIGDRPLTIETELTAALPVVYVDQDRIVQALVGLFSHAIDAMHEGTIRLAARIANGPPGPAAQHLRIDVTDSGRGIRDTDQETLFEAFRELQEPSGRRIGGLGLGLSVARELVRAHGGDIWFETEPGRGTTFSVAIPLDNAKSSSPGRPRRPPELF
jgi:signal transduction histidine kinase